MRDEEKGSGMWLGRGGGGGGFVKLDGTAVADLLSRG